MVCWNFSFLGGVEATYQELQYSGPRNGQREVHLNDLMGKKAGAVLALLALSPGRARPREEIIDLIWPEIDFEEARDRFKQQLTLLRKRLEPAGVAPGSVLITNRSQAGIATGHQSDVAQFLQSLRRAAAAPDARARVQCLREALALYKGEFAPGFYQDVLLTERERLAALAEEAQKRLAALEANQVAVEAVGAAPPPVTPRAVPTPNRFFGRAPERERIPQLLQQNQLVTLLGPGGTGKTRLLQEMQADLPDSHLVFLSTLRSGTVLLDAIVASLNLPDSSDTALARLKKALLDKDTLLMLDNMEQLVESGGAEAVSELLAAVPTLRVLVTSRLKLNLPQECVYVLAPLPQDEAVALFINRASLARATFTPTNENRETIAELCQRLDGLPLAIELAAARAAILTPSQILERLSRRFDLLTDRRRDREERHTSLRAALDWGWGLLAPDVQHFFAQLCVFRGSFSLEAAEVVTGEFLAIDYLQYLADASFLIVESGEGDGQEGSQRFRLLETLREYGREQWEKWDAELGDERTLPQRHFDFFLARVQEWRFLLKGERFSTAMAWFKEDHDNFIAALDYALESDPLRAIELCELLTTFLKYAYRKREELNYLNKTMEKIREQGLSHQLSSKQWAVLHDNLATSYHDLRDFPRAHQHFQEALLYHEKYLQEAEGDEHRAARISRAGTLHNLANVLYMEHRLEEAHPYYAEAAELNRALDNKGWLANNLNGLCCICGGRAFQTDNLELRTLLLNQGLAYAREAEAICRAIPKEYYLCYMLAVQSNMLLGLERNADALAILSENFALSCRLENWEVLLEVLIHLHHIAFRFGNESAAVQFLGCAAGMGKRWELDVDNEYLPHLVVTDERRATLAAALGAETYDQLYLASFEGGFHNSMAPFYTMIDNLRSSRAAAAP